MHRDRKGGHFWIFLQVLVALQQSSIVNVLDLKRDQSENQLCFKGCCSMQVSMALQHEQQRGTHLELQLDAVSEQLLAAQQALLQEQLRADRLAGQRESLERTLRQAQEALHEQARQPPPHDRPWSASDALEVPPRSS